MIGYILTFFVGMCAGGTVVYLFRAKGEQIIADVKKDVGA